MKHLLFLHSENVSCWPRSDPLKCKENTARLVGKKYVFVFIISFSSLTVLSGHVDVEVKAVLALVLHIRRCGIQVVSEPNRQHDFRQNSVNILGTDGCKLCCVADLLPRARSFRRLEAALSDRCGGIWHSEVLFHRGQDLIAQLPSDASDLPVASGHYGVLQVDPLARGEDQVEYESQEQQQTATGHPLWVASPTAALMGRNTKREKQHVRKKRSSWHIRKSSNKKGGGALGGSRETKNEGKSYKRIGRRGQIF